MVCYSASIFWMYSSLRHIYIIYSHLHLHLLSLQYHSSHAGMKITFFQKYIIHNHLSRSTMFFRLFEWKVPVRPYELKGVHRNPPLSQTRTQNQNSFDLSTVRDLLRFFLKKTFRTGESFRERESGSEREKKKWNCERRKKPLTN